MRSSEKTLPDLFQTQILPRMQNGSIDSKQAILELKALLDKGLDINSSDARGNTLLHLLSSCIKPPADTDIAEVLLKDYQADLSLQAENDGFNNTPLLNAIADNRKDLTRCYLQYASLKTLNTADKQFTCQNSPLILAIKMGWADIALELIQKGVDLTYRAADSLSALDYACLLRLENVIAELLNRGINPNDKNRFGARPKDYYFYDYVPLDSEKYLLREYFQTSSFLIWKTKKPIIPDITEAIYHPGFQNRKKLKSIPPEEKPLFQGEQNASPSFKARINQLRSDSLSIRIDALKKLGSIEILMNQPEYRILLDFFDNIFASTLQAYPERYGDPLNEAKEALIFQEVKKRFIETILAHPSILNYFTNPKESKEITLEDFQNAYENHEIKMESHPQSVKITFEQFKSHYFNQKENTFLNQSWNELTWKLRNKEISNIEQVEEYCHSHPKSPANKILQKLRAQSEKPSKPKPLTK